MSDAVRKRIGGCFADYQREMGSPLSPEALVSWLEAKLAGERTDLFNKYFGTATLRQLEDAVSVLKEDLEIQANAEKSRTEAEAPKSAPKSKSKAKAKAKSKAKAKADTKETEPKEDEGESPESKE